MSASWAEILNTEFNAYDKPCARILIDKAHVDGASASSQCQISPFLEKRLASSFLFLLRRLDVI